MTAPTTQTIRYLPVDEIVSLDCRRSVDESAVARLVESTEKVGLLTPISFRLADAPDPETGDIDQSYVLITGRHRVEAFKRLGRTEIPAIERDCSERGARLEKITENRLPDRHAAGMFDQLCDVVLLLTSATTESPLLGAI